VVCHSCVREYNLFLTTKDTKDTKFLTAKSAKKNKSSRSSRFVFKKANYIFASNSAFFLWNSASDMMPFLRSSSNLAIITGISSEGWE